MKKIKSLFATPKKTAVTVICLLAVIAIIAVGTVSAVSAVVQSTSIGEENAENFAFADAGVDPVSAQVVRTEFDFEQGQFVYEVEFIADGNEYEYWIKASDGSVVKKEVEMFIDDGTNIKVFAKITADEAKEIALADQGLTFSDVTFVKEKLDIDNGNSVYEIEFYTESTEYEYEVDANTGSVYSVSKEPVSKKPDTPPATESQNNSSQQTDNQQNNNSQQTDCQNQSQAGQISLDKAKSISLADAGVAEAEATFTKAVQDRENGAIVYDIEFYTSSYEYDYEIDAATGKILSKDAEPVKTSGNMGSGNQQNNNSQQTDGQNQSQAGQISLDKAKSISLADAGVAEAEATFTKAVQDRENGAIVYDIEFYTSSYEYDYEIDAATGKILSKDAEPVKTSGNTEGGNTGSQNSDSYIGIDKAKSIAVSHAGFSVADVTFSKTKLDHDDGYTVYEIEFYKNGTEYEYTVNALTGDILDYEFEKDD